MPTEPTRRIPDGTEVDWAGIRARVTSHVPETKTNWRRYRIVPLDGPYKGRWRTVSAAALETRNPDALREVDHAD